jgi:hypothetical protein
MQPHHPQLQVAPADLRPTQLTVGYAEVAAKRAEWEKLARKKRRELLGRHWFPGVLGPGGKVYIVDHHHLGLALIEEKVDSVPVMVLRDFSWLDPAVFWRTMEFNRWAHPYDAHGHRTDYDAFPAKLTELADDPYRTLSARVREAGGYSKDATPYAEFLWADFLRSRVKLKGEQPGKRALKQSLELAHTREAAYLPGWSGLIA